MLEQANMLQQDKHPRWGATRQPVGLEVGCQLWISSPCYWQGGLLLVRDHFQDEMLPSEIMLDEST